VTTGELADLARGVLARRRDLFDEATRLFPLPGGVVTVADSSGVVGEVAFGAADPEGREPMDATRLFEIGSISKLFTALAVNQLVDEGRLGLDETIGDVLAWVSLGETSGTVSVTELLSHTSGLCVGADTLADDAGEIVNSRVCERASGPARFHYSNLGYLVLGEMVRARAGRLSEIVAQQWLAPLGMTHALAEVSYAHRSSFAVGSWPERPDQPWAPGDPVSRAPFFEVDSASGNVAARGSDMAALMSALLRASRGEAVRDDDGRVVLSAETYARITSPLAPTGEPTYCALGVAPVEESRYAMGINVERVGGHRCVSHGGGMVGYSTFMLVDTDAGFGVSVLTNANGDTLASHMLARVIHADLVDALEGRSPGAMSLGHGAIATHQTGVFTSPSASLEVRATTHGARVLFEGDEADLVLLAHGRYVTTLAPLRRFHLDWNQGDESWTWGEATFSRAGAPSPATPTPEAHELTGHYRSFSPWFPEFRIIARGARLLLAAPGGVEAPSDEVALVALSDDEYRLGEDPWLPERLRVVARRGGEVVSVERDGCVYSRVFSP
jgi:D-alanyl-D-alanine carboxypeptidase